MNELPVATTSCAAVVLLSLLLLLLPLLLLIFFSPLVPSIVEGGVGAAAWVFSAQLHTPPLCCKIDLVQVKRCDLQVPIYLSTSIDYFSQNGVHMCTRKPTQVGATNAMRMEAVAKDGRKVVLKYAHEDLEVCVGIATAAFAVATLRGDVR